MTKAAIVTVHPESWESPNPLHCPKCGDLGYWRRGIGFEHEKRCPKCEESWDPEEIAGRSPILGSLIPAQWQSVLDENKQLREENEKLKELNLGLSERVAAQSEILARVSRRR